MIRSMTGYGSAELERSGQRLTAEIRSVNHRFCEVSMRGPKVALAFEDQVRQLIQDRFSRGKFNLTITWAGAGDQGEVLKINEAVAQRYVDLMAQLKARFKLAGDVDVSTVAALPDLFTWEHTAMSDEESWALVRDVVEKSCDNMNLMKTREGAALTHVDGRPVDPVAGPSPLLAAAGGTTVELTFAPAEGDGPSRRVAVVPLIDERPLRYQDWVAKRRAVVRELSDDRCGYLHIPDMGGSGWAQFNRDLRREMSMPALIVDVRGNAGGNISETARVLGLTRRGLYLKLRRLGLESRAEEVDTH